MRLFFYRIFRFIGNFFKSLFSKKHRAHKAIKQRVVDTIKDNVVKMRFKHPQAIGRVLNLPVGKKRTTPRGSRSRFKTTYIMARKRIFKSAGRGHTYFLIDA